MTEPFIPLVDLQRQHSEIGAEVQEGWDRILRSGSFILSDEVSDFESEFADYVGVEYCLGVGNGTDALELCLRALDVSVGDEIILPANSFVASATAVARTGGRVRFADVDPDTLLLDPRSVAEQLTEGTKVVMPVHLFGQMAPMEEIEKVLPNEQVSLLEDAAQAQGASRDGRKAGSWGRLAGTSFYPGKNLGAYGDAGAVLTNEQASAERVRRLRNHGSVQKYVHDTVGFNSRLDALQAVVLRAKLRRLDEWNTQRASLAERYTEAFRTAEHIRTPRNAEGNHHVWHLYVVRVPDRDAAVERLHSQGIGVQIHYPTALHLTGAFRDAGYQRGDLPAAETAADEILSLPLYPGMTPAQQDRVIDAVLGLAT